MNMHKVLSLKWHDPNTDSLHQQAYATELGQIDKKEFDADRPLDMVQLWIHQVTSRQTPGGGWFRSPDEYQLTGYLLK